jgi:hypothetical protein
VDVKVSHGLARGHAVVDADVVAVGMQFDVQPRVGVL